MKADDAVPETPRTHEGVGAAASTTTRRCQPFGHASYSLRRTAGVRAMGLPGPEEDLGVGSGSQGRRSLANAGPVPLPQGRRDRRPADAEWTLMVQLLGPGRPHTTNSCPVRGSGDVSNQPVESCLPWAAVRTTSHSREASAIQTPSPPGEALAIRTRSAGFEPIPGMATAGYTRPIGLDTIPPSVGPVPSLGWEATEPCASCT